MMMMMKGKMMFEIFIAVALFAALVSAIGEMLEYIAAKLERRIRAAVREEIEWESDDLLRRASDHLAGQLRDNLGDGQGAELRKSIRDAAIEPQPMIDVAADGLYPK